MWTKLYRVAATRSTALITHYPTYLVNSGLGLAIRTLQSYLPDRTTLQQAERVTRRNKVLKFITFSGLRVKPATAYALGHRYVLANKW
jgi:hypothetical protein